MATVRRSNRSNSAANKTMKDVSDDEDSWDDSDDNQQKPVIVGNKRKATKREENADPNIVPAARKRQRSAAVRADLHDLTLLEIIMKHSNAIDNAVKEWMERYRSDRAAAAAELMTLLVKASGCDADLSSDDVEAGEVDQLAARLTNTVVQEGGVDLFHNHRAGRSIIENYRLFWDKVLRQLAAADLLFDDFELNDKLCRMVTALSISVVRSFRYAATLTAAQLISTWISISAGLTESRELAKFQLDAEEKKKKPSREVVAALRRTVDRCHSRVEDLRNFRSVTFTGVFSHRFRDVSDEIRAVVIESIGSWVVALPTEFLADTYLKYLAWSLSDKSPLVRGKALAALEKLYSDSDNIPRLQDFTNRFTGRFIELMYDVDESVAAAGLQVLALLVEQQVIKDKDVSGVYSMLTLPNASLRHAAAALVAQLLPGQGREVVEAAQEQLQADAAANVTVGGSQQGAKSGKGGRGKGSKGPAAAAASDATAAPLAAAAAILKDDKKLKLAGLLAVMARLALNEPVGGDLTAAERRASLLPSQGITAAAALGGATLHTLPAAVVWNLVDALWDQAADVVGDISGLADELSEDGAVELRGKLGNAHLAAVLAAAVKRSIQGAALVNARKGRFGRPRVTAAAGNNVDEDAQQAATVALMQKLPALLTKFQSEPHVVAPLLAVPRLLRLELYSLGGQVDNYRGLLQQIDGLLQRHNLHELLTEAAASLAHASKEGPAALQEVGMQVLHTSSSTSANKLSAAAKAVSRLKATELAEGVADMIESPVDAPDALLSLLTSLRRCHALMAAGAHELARDKQLATACQTLLQQSLEGRELGAAITSLLLQVSNTSLLWQQVAVTADPSNLNAFINSRNSFMRVLEALMDSMGSEQLVPPEHVLKGTLQDLGVSLGELGSQDVVTDVTDQLSAGIPTLQDQAAQLLMDLIFVGGGLVAALQGDGNAAGALDKVAPSRSLLERCWRYCLSVLDREGPDLEAFDADNDDEAVDVEEDEHLPGNDLDGWDMEDAAARRARRRAAKREALSAAAASLGKLQLSVVVALSKLCLYKTLPEPHLSWMLSKLVTLLDGRGPQITGLVRALLQQVKHSSPDALPSICISALTDLYESAEDTGHEENEETWELMAGVATKIAGLYIGHNLSQGPLHSLISRGLNWVFEAPGSRAAFLTTCLTPFTSKLAPQEAERVAGEVMELVASDDVSNMLADDQETAEVIDTYIRTLEDRAAGKKPARGVLKTPARAAAAEPEDKVEDDEAPPTAAAAAGSRRQPRGSRIKFAADVEVSPEGQQEAAAGQGSEGEAAAAARGGTRRQQQRRSSGSHGKRQRQGDEQDDGWDSDNGQQQQQSDSSSGWHSKRSGGKGKQSSSQQQRSKRRRRQQQQENEQLEQFIDEEDEEVQQQQQQQHKSPAGRTRGRQQQSPFAAAAVAAAPPKQQSARAALRMFAGEAGPLETQSQSQSQSQQQATGRGAARRGRSAAAAAAAATQDLRAGPEDDDDQQQQHSGGGDIDMADGGIADAADLDLAAGTDADDHDLNPDWQQQHDLEAADIADQQQGAAGNSLGLGHDPDESEDLMQQQMEAEHDAGQNSDGEGGALSQYSEPLSNVEVVLDEITDLGEVDEPPPQPRRGRRRR